MFLILFLLSFQSYKTLSFNKRFLEADTLIKSVSPSIFIVPSSIKITVTFNEALNSQPSSFTLTSTSPSNAIPLTCTNSQGESSGQSEFICENTTALPNEYAGEYKLSYSYTNIYEYATTMKLSSNLNEKFSLKKIYELTQDSKKQFKITIEPLLGGDFTLEQIQSVIFKDKNNEEYKICSECEHTFELNEQNNLLTIVIPMDNDSKYSLYRVEDKNQNIIEYGDNAFILRDYSVITNPIIIDKDTNYINIIIDFLEESLVSDTIYVGDSTTGNSCTEVAGKPTQKTCTFNSLDTKPTDLSIKINTDDTLKKTINVIKYSQNYHCAISESNENIEVTFDSSSPTDFYVYFGKNDANPTYVEITGPENSKTITYDKTKFGDAGSSQSLFYNKVETDEEKYEIPNSSIEIISKLNVIAYTPLKATGTAETLKILFETATDSDLTSIILQNNGHDLPCNSFTKVRDNEFSCSVTISDNTPLTLPIYYLNKCGGKSDTGKTISIGSDLVTSLPEKFALSSITTEAQKIVIGYAPSVLLPTGTKIQFVDKDEKDISNFMTKFELKKNNDETYISIENASDLVKGEYKIKTIPQAEDPSYSFFSDKTILIYHSALSLDDSAPALSLTQTSEQTNIEITFNQEICKEQISSVKLSVNPAVSIADYSIKGEKVLVIPIPANNLKTVGSYQISIVDKVNQDNPLHFTFSVTSKYSITSFSPNVFQSTNSVPLVITYNLKFTDLESPTSIELVPTKDGQNSVTFIKNNIIFDNEGEFSTATLTPSELEEGTYNIKTNFEGNYEMYTFTSSNEQVVTISIIDISGITFDFNRLFFVKKTDADTFALTITVTDPKNIVSEINCKDCKDASDNPITVTYQNKIGSATLSKPGTYSFEYVVSNNIKFDIAQKVIISSEALVDLSVTPSPCNFIDDLFTITIDYKEITETTEKERIIPMISVPESDPATFEFDKGDEEGKYQITAEATKTAIKDKKVKILLTENKITESPLKEFEVSFSSITPPEYCLKGFPCKFTATCDLSSLSNRLKLKQETTEITFSSCTAPLSCTVNGNIAKYGTYTSYIDSTTISSTFVSNSISESIFTVNLPTIEPKDLSITITNEQNDFYMNLIETLTLTKEGSTTPIVYSKASSAEAGTFTINNNVISFSLTYAEGETYVINSIQRTKEVESETVDDIKHLFTTGNTITDNPFIINKPHQYIEKTKTENVIFEITPNLPSILSIEYRFIENSPDADGTCSREGNQDKITCSIPNISEAKIVYFTAGGKKHNGYISLYEVSETTCYDIDTTTPVKILTLTTPSGIDSQPQLKIGGLTTSKPESAPYVYSAQYNSKQSFPFTDAKPILFYSDTDQVELATTFSFTLKYTVNAYKGLLQNKDSQFFLVTFAEENFDKNLSEITLYLDNSSTKKSATCTKQTDLNYKCSFDLSSVEKGAFSFGYTSKCGASISLGKTITVYDDTSLPFRFSSDTITVGHTITVSVTESTMTYLFLYIKEEKDSSYILMSKDSTTNLSFTNIPTKEGTYTFAYSLVENQEQVAITKKLTVSSVSPSNYKLYPDIETCYYNSKPVSFTIKTKEGNEIEAGKSFTVSITLSGKEEPNSLTLSDKYLFTIGTDGKGVTEGVYIISIKDEGIEVYTNLITFTSVKVEDFYYKSKITVQAICVLKLTLSDNTELSCSKVETNVQKCTLPENFSSYAKSLAVKTGDEIVKESTIISNDISTSTFTIGKPSSIVEGNNDFTISSKDFSLDKISQFTITGKADPLVFTSTDANNKFTLNAENNQISFSIKLESLTGTYTLTTIQRTHETSEEEKDYQKTLNDVLYSLECTEGLIKNEEGKCILPENDDNIEGEDKCLNYCINGTCSIVDSKPICQCIENYYGVTCSMTSTTVTEKVGEYVKEIFTGDGSTSIETTINNDEAIVKMRTISQLAQQNYLLLVDTIKNEKPIIEATSKFIFITFYRKYN